MSDDLLANEIHAEMNFWDERQRLNATKAIFHQWDQLEKTGCIDNFRITAGLKMGFRQGFFFADSDAYKWLEAAARILDSSPPEGLPELVDSFIDILEKAQESDGYLYTYNQLHFPGVRWDNLLIDHELYCIGHLIEAGIAHHRATGNDRLFSLTLRTADLLVSTFMDAPAVMNDGHEEIEIALVRLSRHSGQPVYRQLASRLLQRRGRISTFWFQFARQTLRMAGKMHQVTRARSEFFRRHHVAILTEAAQRNPHTIPLSAPLRFALSALNGNYIQQHAPLEEQSRPEGHAVRFTYLQTAIAMLARDENDRGVLARLEAVWQHMVSKRMFVTGGLGSLPLIEGFGRDYELDPQAAYAETCAALGSILWNREMAALTHDPRYPDLEEWQLYNAAAVGMGLDGTSYFYNNPLTCSKKIARLSWYDVPCCPSNISRIWAGLAEAVFLVDGDSIYINQYLGGKYTLGHDQCIRLSSRLPWGGRTLIEFELDRPTKFDLYLRLPAWSQQYDLRLNNERLNPYVEKSNEALIENAVGLHFENSGYIHLKREFSNGDLLELDLEMPLRLRKQDRRIPKCGGMQALTRGPLVFCLESNDNPGGVSGFRVITDSLRPHFKPDLLGGMVVIDGVAEDGRKVRFIPYMLWGNRGPSDMTVFFKAV